MNRGVRIVATGTFPGETILSAAEVAASIGGTEAAVARWIGKLTVHVSALSAPEIGARAGVRCLEKAGVAADDVQVVIWGSSAQPDLERDGRRELRAQHLIGAARASVIEVGLPCSESITALRLARSLVDGDPAVERVLVVFGERRSKRTLGFDATAYQPVFSDVGAALLLERAETDGIVAMAEDCDGSYWDFLLRARENAKHAPLARGPASALAVDPLLAKASVDAAKQCRRALDRCLELAGLDRSRIDHVILTREGARIPSALMRSLDVPVEKLFVPTTGPTHAGMSDVVIDFEALTESGALRPGQHVLLGARAVGTIRFCLYRV